MSQDSFRPLIAHVIYRLDVGGLENGLVNLINRMPAERYRHAVVCLTDYTDFSRRIQSPETPVLALHKRPGQDPGMHLRLWRLLRQMRPMAVHTRNLTALDTVVAAALAGVPLRIHGEHGRDLHDLDMTNRKYRWLRRVLRPLVHRYVALSGELETYLVEQVGVRRERVSRICNGVDDERFHPADAGRQELPLPGFATSDCLVVGTVGRMKDVKDPLNLARAFERLACEAGDARRRLRLVMVGDGPLLAELRSYLGSAGLEDVAWLPGDRDDVPRILRGLDLFVLPSLAEGISNGILEAMASGLPVVATDVGGNSELVRNGDTGWLVPRADPEPLAHAMRRYLDDPTSMRSHGAAGRRRIEAEFSLEKMVERYTSLYGSLVNDYLARRPLAAKVFHQP